MSSFTTSAGDPDREIEHETLKNVDYYAILGVTKEATTEEIKKAFKRLAITFHPDKFVDELQREAAQGRFKEIKEAYDVLLNATLRTLYDDFGAEAVKKQMNMQVGRPVQSSQQFLRDMFRMRRQQHQAYIMRQVDHTGNFMLLLDSSNAYGQLRPILSTISIRQNVKFPLSAHANIRLGFAALMSNGISKGSVKLSYDHAFRAMAAAGYASLRMGWEGYQARFGCSKELAQDIFGDMNLTLQEGSPRLRFKVVRTFSEMWQASIETILSKATPSLRLSINTPSGHPHWGALFMMALKQGSIESSARYQYHWSDRTTLSIEAGVENSVVLLGETPQPKSGVRVTTLRQLALMNGWYLAGNAERTISQLTKAHVGFTIAPHGVFISPGFTRHGQTFSVPIMLNHMPTLKSAVLAVLAPLAIGLVLEAILLEPRRRRKRLAQEEKRRKQKEAQVAAAKARAEADCRLMADEVMRKREFEESKGGLVILQAFYGRHPDSAEDVGLDLDADEERSDRLDVTLPVQYMIQNSQLQISSGNSKSAFIGFYDPIPDEEKWIEIVYLYRHKTHRVLASDLDALRLPLKSHQMD
jgi:DnaJ family protein C protein 11